VVVASFCLRSEFIKACFMAEAVSAVLSFAPTRFLVAFLAAPRDLFFLNFYNPIYDYYIDF